MSPRGGGAASELAARPWASEPRVEIVEADPAEDDRPLAETFATAAARAGAGRIIHLGGLGEQRPGLSEHLSSR